MKKMRIVPHSDAKFGLVYLVKAKATAASLLGFVNKKWTKEMKHPSNYMPNSEE